MQPDWFEAVEAGMSRLPWQQRVVLVLSDVQGLSYEEIAAATGTSPGVVKARLSQARARLRDHLFRRGDRHGLPGIPAQLVVAATEGGGMTPKNRRPAGLMGRERRAASPEQRPDTGSRQEAGAWR